MAEREGRDKHGPSRTNTDGDDALLGFELQRESSLCAKTFVDSSMDGREMGKAGLCWCVKKLR